MDIAGREKELHCARYSLLEHYPLGEKEERVAESLSSYLGRKRQFVQNAPGGANISLGIVMGGEMAQLVEPLADKKVG